MNRHHLAFCGPVASLVAGAGATVVILALLCAASLVHAQEITNEEAKALYEEAVMAYSEGNLEEAAALLESAFDIDPNAILAYNIGKAYDESGQFKVAQGWYLKSLSLEGLPETQRRRAAKAIERITNTEEEIRAKVKEESLTTAKLKVTSIPAAAQVFVDGKPVGETPIALTLSPGSFSVLVKGEGFEPYNEVVELGAGESVHVRAALIRPNSYTLVYVSGGLALAALSVGIVTDVLASQAYDDAQLARDNPSKLETLKSDGQTLQLVAITGYGIAGAAAITGLVLFLIDDGQATEVVYEPLGFTPEILLEPTGASLRFRW